MATKEVKLSEYWALASEGSCFAQKKTSTNVDIFIDAQIPDEDILFYHTWEYGDFNYGGGENVYMRCSKELPIVVTEI